MSSLQQLNLLILLAQLFSCIMEIRNYNLQILLL
uniref:Uncharacterized protein n=1 Tax=Siphoviridae sp. ct2vX3 TaxID=2825318 RepID=A0A8S5PXY5_9CAUD|nr:MAG TPA: hypothetical protein [Siphoviridae sp. ct2vX3]